VKVFFLRVEQEEEKKNILAPHRAITNNDSTL